MKAMGTAIGAAGSQRRNRVGARIRSGFVGLLLVVAHSVARAEPQRVEVVGAYPIREALRSKVNPRDEAIQKALWEGVSRVALELIGEEGEAEEAEVSKPAGTVRAAGPPIQETKLAQEPPDATARFRKIFGPKILPYTRSFRIVEDRGERPVLFADEPGVRSEYLVVVEVLVDVDRVTSELARAGLVGRPGGTAASHSVTLELVGLERYAGLRVVLETLRRELAATRIETLEFAPARQLLRIDGPFGPDEIAARIGRLESAELILDAVEVDREAGHLRVMAQWFPPAPVEPADPTSADPGAPASIPRRIPFRAHFPAGM